MKKRILAIALVIAVLIAAFPLTAFAEVNQGGLDFVSVTINYETPTVVSYRKVKANDKLVPMKNDDGTIKYKKDGTIAYGTGFVFSEATDKYIVYAGESVANGYTQYDDVASARANFYEVIKEGAESSIRYSKLPYKYAYLTSIGNDSTIRTKSSINFYGVMEIVDDAGTLNPNFIYKDDKFILAEEKDAEGNPMLIDFNGYLLDENYLWHDSQGRRVEPFYLNDDNEYVWIPVADRFAENGSIKSVSEMMGGAQLFRVVVDYNGDTKYDETDYANAAYNDPNTVFTASDIMLDQKGNMVRGTPVIGTKQTNIKIKSITVEIDALGSQVYSDLASDPQQKNTITVSIQNPAEYITLADAFYADKEVKEFNGIILGTVKSQTTKTSMKWEKGKSVETAVSIDLNLTADQLAAIPEAAQLYLQFHIETLQDAGAFDASQIEEDITTEKFVEWVEPAPEATPAPKSSSGCNSVVTSGAAVISIALVGAYMLLKKKKK